jgi:uncharacterized membrane protein YgcG
MILVVLHPAGLLQGLAAACEQVAAVLTQQQQAHMQQEQQQRQVTQVLAQLSSVATAYCLLNLWCGVVFVCHRRGADAAVQLFRAQELRPTIVPACKLMAAAAVALLGGNRPGSSSSSSSSSSRRRSSRSGSSSISFWQLAATTVDLWEVICSAKNLLEHCTHTDYRKDGIQGPAV